MAGRLGTTTDTSDFGLRLRRAWDEQTEQHHCVGCDLLSCPTRGATLGLCAPVLGRSLWRCCSVFYALPASLSTVLTDWTTRAIENSSGKRLEVTECDISLSEHSWPPCRCTHSVFPHAVRQRAVQYSCLVAEVAIAKYNTAVYKLCGLQVSSCVLFQAIIPHRTRFGKRSLAPPR